MQRIALLAVCAVVASCHRTISEGGIQANVHIDPDAFVTCVQLSALDSSGKTLGTTQGVVKGKQTLSFPVTQGDYPDVISLHAVGLYSASDCADPALPNSQPADLTDLHFSPGVAMVDLTLHRPSSADDGDGDGFIAAAKGGPDCDDANPASNPAAAENCTELVDLNCNGKYGCDDPTCAGKTCLSPPASVAFASSPQSAASQMCSGAIVLELHDASGASVPAGAKTTVSLAEMGSLGLNLYSDSGCTVPAMSADIAMGQRQVRFYVRGSKAGSTMLQATSAGLSPAAQAFVVAPGAATNVYFTSAAQTVKADRCSAPVTLETRDLQMNAAPVAADVAYTISANPSTGVSLFSDATCMTALGSPKIASGTSSATFYFRAVRMPGMVTLNVMAPPLMGDAQVETVAAGDPANLTFTTGSQMVGAGVCSGAMTVQLVDAHGVNTTPAPGMTVSLAGPSYSFFSDVGCTMAANGSAMFSPTTGSATVYFKATTAGMSTVTASGGGLPNATQAETIAAGPPAQLIFQNPSEGVSQSTCSGPDMLAVKDAYGNTAVVTGVPLSIALSASPSTGFTFYQAGACSSAVTSVQIPVGQSAVGFNFYGTMAVPVTVTATSSLQPNPTQMINFNVGPPNKLVFTTAPQTKKANACSGAVTLQAQDSGGNVVTLSSPLNINLAAAPSTGFGFYSDPLCSMAVSQAAIGTGASQATYYFKGTAAGAVTMSTGSSLAVNPTQVATIQPEVAGALVFTNLPLTVTAGVCSAALTLQSRDAYGNASPVAADTAVMLSAMPATNITFFSDATCATAVLAVTLPNGSSSVPFYVKANSAPTYSLQALAGSLGMASQVLTVNPAAASQLVILTSGQTKNTGQCSSAVTVQRQDTFGNPVTTGNATVTLSQNPAGGGLQFFTDMGCSTATTSVAIGTGNSTATVFFEGSVPGMPTLIASSGILAQASQKENINVSPAAKLAFLSAAQTAVPAGTCSAAVTVQSEDPLGNPSPVVADTTLTLGAPPSGAAFYSDPGCSNVITQATLSAGTSQTSWYFKGTVALSFMVSATAPSLGAASQNATIIAAGLSQLAFVTPVRSQSVGQCSQKLTVQRQDAYGNPVTGGNLTVNLTAMPSMGFALYADSSCPAANPVTSINIIGAASTQDFYYKGTLPGVVHVTATASGAGSVGQDETVSSVPPSTLVFTTPARSAVASICSLVMTVQARDGFGNPSPVASATPVTVSSTGGNMSFFTDSACTTNAGIGIPASGTDASFYATGTLVSTPTVTANAGALGMATQMFTITPASPYKLVYTTSAQSVKVAQCSNVVSVQVQDFYGNPSGVTGSTTLAPAVVPASTVSFFQDNACSTPLGAGVVLNTGNTLGSFYMKGGNTVGTGNVTVSTASLNSTPQQMVTVTVGVPNKLTFTSAAKPNLTAGECSTAITVELDDVGGNATTSLTSTAVTLSSNALSGFAFYSDLGCTMAIPSVSIPSGTSVATFYVKGITGSGGGNITMTAAASGLNSGTQNVIVLNAVMNGTCTVANTTNSVQCGIIPAVKDTTKTLLMFQAPNNGTGPANSQIRCELTDSSHITCSRGGTSGDVTVTWYTLTLAKGLSVQHLNGISATGTSQTVSIPTPVSSVNDTFLLMSSDFGGGTFSGQAFTSAQLLAANQVTLTRQQAPSSTLKHAIQVVEWTGATVARGLVSITNNNLATSNVGVPDAGTTPTFLLSTWAWKDASSDEPCREAIHPGIVDAANVVFARGASSGSTNCNNNQIDIAYERVSLPSVHRVDVFGDVPAAGFDGTTITLTNGAVDLTRTLAFFSGQGLAGQTSGECQDTTVDRMRDCELRTSFVDANNVATTRPTVSGSTSAALTLFVLQVSP
jgi:hypothetical protein